jgi:DNA-binding protein H-NS
MASYKELQDQIAELQRKAEEARAEEVGGAIEKIRMLMSDYEITVNDLVGGKKKSGKSSGTAQVQFRDNEGNTWSGRGRMPRWLSGKDKEQFRVA